MGEERVKRDRGRGWERNGAHIAHKKKKGGGGGDLFGLFEQRPHSGGTPPDKHLNKVAARAGEEGHAGLGGHGAGQEGLSRAGRAHQKEAGREPGPHRDEPSRVLEHVHDLGEGERGVEREREGGGRLGQRAQEGKKKRVGKWLDVGGHEIQSRPKSSRRK